MMQSTDHARSYYRATANALTERPALGSDLTADVCVIGGGFTGVNTAIELAQRGLSVILLEARRIGWGASGRNGGAVGSGIGRGRCGLRQDVW
ncbi:NAD(P)/FAD-dependent oxidoreductase, partial [Pseudomonas canadensis]|uniref:NAD(P)/FAD-dependent oxidoreductase n=1 Tax=Pseudomonas canadensis TaxID=915099 RepID=UPI001F40BCD1